jgi:hypothetical protein
VSSDKLDLSVDVGGGSLLTASVDGAVGGAAYRTETVPLDADRTGSLARAIYSGTFTGLSVALTARLPVQGDTEDIDAVQLELRYQPPALRAAGGCVTAVPYPSNTSACALASGRLFVDGTVYAPDGVLDLSVGPGTPAVRAGVVARALHLRAALSGVAMEVPDDSPAFTFGVQLVAYVCPGAVLCAPSGRPALQARIGLVDADPTAPVAGRRAVTVLGWWRSS